MNYINGHPSRLMGFVKLNEYKNPRKTRKWVGGLNPNSDFYFFENVAFFVCFCAVFMFPNVSKQEKWKGGGGCMGSDRSEFFLNFWMFFYLDETSYIVDL